MKFHSLRFARDKLNLIHHENGVTERQISITSGAFCHFKSISPFLIHSNIASVIKLPGKLNWENRTGTIKLALFCSFAIKRDIMRNCSELLFKHCWQLLLWPLKGTRGRVFLITRFAIPVQYNTKVHCTEIMLIGPNEIFLSVFPFENEHLLGHKLKYASLTRLVPSIY